VTRDVGLARRRCETSATERPRVMLNRMHELVAVIETHLERTGDEGIAPIQDWLDRFCKDVLDERAIRALNVMLPKLQDQLTAITGIPIRMSSTDLRVLRT
jgi:hypothetical protein